MPNFNVHWLVAFRGLSGQFDVPWYLTRGFEFYRLNTLALGASVREELNSIASDDELFGFFKNPISFHTYVRDRFWDVANTYYGNLARKPRDYNAVTCFSAFALGACGPDFWTMGSESKLSSKKMTAGLHFDLGHYNRTHQQFRVSAARLSKIDPKIILGTLDENSPPDAGWNKATLSARAEFSYFLGMTTHLATDLVVHQLVNMSAGAYSVLDKPWKNEQGVAQELVNLWSTHNKVEHFWDTYVRYRYFSDYGKIFSDEVHEWTASLNFPSVETLLRDAEKQSADRQKRIKKILSIEAVMLAIETGFNFPRIFADRLRSGSIDPFIHEVVVNKTTGAYPTDDIFKEAATEAVSDQMRMEGSTINDERRKVGAFATANNRGSSWYTLNMVNYFVCPSLEKVKKNGLNTFYDLKALPYFLDIASQVASRFTLDYSHAATKNPDCLGSLGYFWNLDTGLGLQIERVRSDTSFEVVTRLNFVHVFDEAGGYKLEYKRNRSYLKQKTATYDFEGTYGYQQGKEAFITCQENEFDDINVVSESKSDAYIDRIRVASKYCTSTNVNLKTFFKPTAGPLAQSHPVLTSSLQKENKLVFQDIRHRLSLWVEASIPELEAKDRLAFYFIGDVKGLGTPPAKFNPRYTDPVTKMFLNGQYPSLTKEIPASCPCLDYVKTPYQEKRGKQYFLSKLLINLELDKTYKRETTPTKWNNVVEYEKHKKHYGCNFAIGTGRHDVLKPIGDGRFWADSDFARYSDLCPTEHTFFTLYALVKTSKGCFDIFSKNLVTEDQLKDIKRIDCEGFVKIVLFYVLGDDGAAQVSDCYIDGLVVPIVESEMA